MPKNVMKGCIFLFAILLISGCATGKRTITTRAYVVDKDRVDQKMEGGNFGYLMGTPVPEDRSDIRKTRKLYVLEFIKEVDESELQDLDLGQEVIREDEPVRIIKEDRPSRRRERERIVIPSFDDEDFDDADSYSSETSYVDYTITKDDTLQKISKKFYDSYSKWPKIYDANKDVIDNPNRIKPGVTIRIPTE